MFSKPAHDGDRGEAVHEIALIGTIWIAGSTLTLWALCRIAARADRMDQAQCEAELEASALGREAA